MKNKTSLLITVCVALLLGACCQQESTPRVKHVILIGLDGVGAYGFQRASTPYMNEMAKSGALSIKGRSVLESSSSQNWMTMLSGAIPNQHGVTSNDWEPDNHNIEPILKNKKGFFPSIFDDIKSQKPEDKVYMYREWGGLGRMFDLSVPDKVVHLDGGVKLLNQAVDDFFTDKPAFTFVDVDETDHVGHTYGHESAEYLNCISKYDSIIGHLAQRLKKENLLDQTVIIVTGDHGGIGNGHGGDTPNEMELMMLFYGGPVTKGKVIESSNIIADIAPTVAGLLGVKMPDECVGKFVHAAFEPKTNAAYSPMPVILPSSGIYQDSVVVTLHADAPDAKIYFTTDNTELSESSGLYEKPLILKQTTALKAVTYVNGARSKVTQASFRVANPSSEKLVHYQLFDHYNGITVPDFNALGKADQQGYVYEFSVAGLNIQEKDHFAVLFTSKLQIDEPGDYWFCLSSDDGSKLYIDDKLVISNDGSHSAKMIKGKVTLQKGEHPIRIEYFDDTAGEFLELSYESSSVPLQVVPFSKLSQ